MKIGAMDNVIGKPWSETFDEAARLGFDGVELDLSVETYQGSEVWSAAGRKALVERSKRAGVEIASVCMASVARLMSNPATHEQGVKAVADLRRFCDELGAKVILFPMSKQSADQPEEEAVALWRDGFRAAFEESAESKALVGMESVGRAGRSADQSLAMIGMVGSPYLGVYYDVGNAAYQGFDNLTEIPKLGKRLFQIHVKEIRAEMGQGKLDFPAIFAAIKKTGYDGYLILETEAGDDPAANAARNLAFVRSLL
jgi:sugar phosphate isomerase/epimerase